VFAPTGVRHLVLEACLGEPRKQPSTAASDQSVMNLAGRQLVSSIRMKLQLTLR